MRIIVIVFLFSLNFASYSQNLVKNGDFEEYNKCPQSFDNPNKLPVNDWGVNNGFFKGSPDYYNACGNYYFSVPKNIFGYYPAQSGNGYIGLIMFSDYGSYEYIQGELKEPMKMRGRYKVSFWVQLLHTRSKYLSNNLGVCFSKQRVFDNCNFVYYDESGSPETRASISTYPNFISDTSWVEVKGEYIAKGGEKYIAFGFFWVDNPEVIKAIEKSKMIYSEDKKQRLLKKVYMKYLLRINPYRLSDEELYRENDKYPLGKYDFAYYLFDNVSVELIDGDEKDKN